MRGSAATLFLSLLLLEGMIRVRVSYATVSSYIFGAIDHRFLRESKKRAWPTILLGAPYCALYSIHPHVFGGTLQQLYLEFRLILIFVCIVCVFILHEVTDMICSHSERGTQLVSYGLVSGCGGVGGWVGIIPAPLA